MEFKYHFRIDDPPSDRSDGKNQAVDGEFGRGRERLWKSADNDCGKGLCRLVTDTWIRCCEGVQ